MEVRYIGSALLRIRDPVLDQGSEMEKFGSGIIIPEPQNWEPDCRCGSGSRRAKLMRIRVNLDTENW